MPEELYTSRDFCELAEKFEELKRENEELRPCPFCGEMPITENNFAACANKSCPTYDNYWTDPQILTIEQWNTRPIEDALNKRIAELEAENERLIVHSDIERQDDKSPNDTQTQTVVYRKEREE